MDRTDIFRNCKSGIDFETRICNMLTEMGLDAKRVGKSDKGVDVIATTPSGYTFNKDDSDCYQQKLIEKKLRGKILVHKEMCTNNCVR